MKIEEITTAIKDTFINSDDLKIREYTFAGKRCLFAYIDGGTDKLLLEQDVKIGRAHV